MYACGISADGVVGEVWTARLVVGKAHRWRAYGSFVYLEERMLDVAVKHSDRDSTYKTFPS